MSRGQHRVVITGMGIVSAIGRTVEDFRQALLLGRSGIGFLQDPCEACSPVRIGAKIHDFVFASGVQHPLSLRDETIRNAQAITLRSPFAVQCSAASALEAWDSSGLDEKSISPERRGIVVAGNNVSQRYLFTVYEKFRESPEYVLPSYALHYMDTDQVGTLSEIFRIRGEGYTAGGASASGNIGIINGCRLVQSGLVDVCMVVGSPADLSPVELQAFHNMGALGGKRFCSQPEKACRPFDSDHEGFIYGQAGGSLILESLESARKRGVRIWAEIMGTAMTLDGNRSSDPNAWGEARAMEAALSQAQKAATDVDYINAHGTSSPLGDTTELKAIRQVFRDHLSKVWINSTKSLTGHCLSSAGVIEAIATVVQMQGGFIHPNRNLINPIDGGCRFSGATAVQADISLALSNSFGFGGINSSILFGKVSN